MSFCENLTNMAAVCAIVFGLTATAAPRAASANEAVFESFSYTGNDDFYNANPLADEFSYYNPILPGWFSDPSICTNGEGDYFLVTSTFCFFPGVPIFHSRDLVNWKQIGYVLNRESQLRNLPGQHISGGIFAPAISYNPANKTYYMVTTNVGWGNFFVKTTDPFGEWSEPILLPEVAGIDPAFFFDTDGKAYIVNNDDAPDYKPEYDGHRTVRIVEFDTENDRCVGERKILVNKGVHPEDKPIWCEGPHIYNINGTYYLMTAEGGTSEGHSEVIYKGESPFGPFTPWKDNPMLTQRNLPADRNLPVTCAGHADLVQAPNGEWWAVFLACRPNEQGFENLGRETFMLPVRWTSDGWPYMTMPGETVALVERTHGAVRGENPTFGNFAVVDDFDAPELGLEWFTVRSDAKDVYSLSSNPGKLTLKCANTTATDKATPAFVARRVQHHKYDLETALSFTPTEQNERAGILLFKDETHQYFLAKGLDKSGKPSIELIRVGIDGDEVLASANVPAKKADVNLKVSSNGPELAFYYSTDGGKKWQLLAEGIDARYTSTANAGGFTGTVVGPYATSKSNNQR